MRKIYYILYNSLAKKSPNYNARILGRVSKKIRSFLYKKITNSNPKGINIHKNASFSIDVKIGDFSDISNFKKLAFLSDGHPGTWTYTGN